MTSGAGRKARATARAPFLCQRGKGIESLTRMEKTVTHACDSCGALWTLLLSGPSGHPAGSCPDSLFPQQAMGGIVHVWFTAGVRKLSDGYH